MSKVIVMPDGKKVRFGDEFTDSEIKALIEQKYPDFAAEQRAQATAAPQRDTGIFGLPLMTKGVDLGYSGEKPATGPAESFGESYAGQGLSGVNEGLGNTLGFPMDASNGLMRLLDFGMTKGGANIIPDLPVDPVGGSKMINDAMSSAGSITPETDDPWKQGLRRIGQEVGATLIPALGTLGKAAKPAKTLATELALATTGGAGAAIANKVAPGNPTAEIIGQLLGGLSPMGVSAMLKRRTTAMEAPTVDDLQIQKSDAYKRVDDLGITYSPQSYRTMMDNITDAVLKDNISPYRHKAALSFIDDLEKRYPNGLTLTELDQLRQEVRRDLIDQPDGGVRHHGLLIRDKIDEMIDSATPVSAMSPSGNVGPTVDASEAINTARELNTRLRKTELVEELLHNADLNAAATGSGGNINNAIRQQLKRILTDKKKSRAFTADELAEIEDVVRQGKMEGFLRLVGKLSPSSSGMSAAAGVGATILNPALGALPLTGMAAKGIADGGTKSKAAILRALIARGEGPGTAPLFNDEQQAIVQALMAGQAANQNAKMPMLTVGTKGVKTFEGGY